MMSLICLHAAELLGLVSSLLVVVLSNVMTTGDSPIMLPILFSEKKIVLKADTTEDLLSAYSKATDLGLLAWIVEDAGHTQVTV